MYVYTCRYSVTVCTIMPLNNPGAHAPEGCGSVSVTEHLTFPMFVCLTNDTTYLTGNEGQNFRAVLSENAPLQG